MIMKEGFVSVQARVYREEQGLLFEFHEFTLVHLAMRQRCSADESC